MNIITDIPKQFSNIEFNEELHKYYIDGKPLGKSVSSIVGRFGNPFDAEAISARMAERDGLDQQELLDSWKKTNLEACELGTITHEFAENYAWNRKLVPETGHQKAAKKFIDELPDHIEIIFTELKMYHFDYLFPGTTDMILYDHKNKYYIVEDHKGFPLDTELLTDSGWKTMKTLNTKDMVYDKDGNLCKVLHKSTVHHKPCIEISFDNGEKITSDEDHRWLITTGVYKKPDGSYREKEVIMTSKEILDYLNTKEIKHQYHRLRIKNAKPLNNDTKDLPIDPYVLGVWLGNGHSADSKITQANPKVWKEIEKRGYELGKNLVDGKNSITNGEGIVMTRTVFNMVKQLKDLNLIENKHIPEIYLNSSFEQRLDLLRGFMDADGYYHPKRKRFVISTTRKSQVDFSIRLLATFGIKPTVINSPAQCNGKKILGYHLCFTTDLFNPFLCRNENITLRTTFQSKYRLITNAKVVKTVPTQCIEVDSPSHTYLVGKELLVTHNTNKDLFKNFAGQTLQDPFGELLDMPFNHYQIQLSIYQILLEQIEGFNVGRRMITWMKPDGSYEMYNCNDYTNVLRDYLNKYYYEL